MMALKKIREIGLSDCSAIRLRERKELRAWSGFLESDFCLVVPLSKTRSRGDDGRWQGIRTGESYFGHIGC